MILLVDIGVDNDIDFKRGMAAGVIGDDLFIESEREEYSRNSATEDKPLEIGLTQLLETSKNKAHFSCKKFVKCPKSEVRGLTPL